VEAVEGKNRKKIIVSESDLTWIRKQTKMYLLGQDLIMIRVFLQASKERARTNFVATLLCV
jgi:hypothetical protein